MIAIWIMSAQLATPVFLEIEVLGIKSWRHNFFYDVAVASLVEIHERGYHMFIFITIWQKTPIFFRDEYGQKLII